MAIIVYDSILELERLALAFPGDDEAYHRYFFAMYNCSPDADTVTNLIRRLEAKNSPDNVVAVGEHFVLKGDSAEKALILHYYAVANDPLLSERMHEYASAKAESIQEKHRRASSLPKPILLTEGELSRDDELGFYVSIALLNGQLRS